MQKKQLSLLKKALPSVLALVLCALVLAGCAAPLPDGVDADTLEAKATAAVDLANQRDYEGLVASLREDLHSQVKPEDWAGAIDPTLDEAGAFEDYGDIATAGVTQNGEEMAAAVVTAKYANGKLLFTLYFDTDSELIGFYVRKA